MTIFHLNTDDVLSAFLDWDDIARQVRSRRATEAVHWRALNHPHHEVRALAARALAGEPRAMAHAACDPHQSVRVVAAHSTSTPPGLIPALSGDRAMAVRHAVAGRSDLDEATCLAMAQDPDISLRNLLAAGPRTSAVLEVLLKDPQPSVHETALANPNLAVDVQLHVARFARVSRRHTLARRSQVAEVLEVLADDPDATVRRALIDNPHAPIAILVALAERDRDLRRQVLVRRHESLPDAVLHRYVEEFMALPDRGIRYWLRLAVPQHTPPLDITEPPALHDHRRLFEVVDRWLPYDLIAHAVGHRSLPSAVRAELLAHPDIPLSTLGQFMNGRSGVLRDAAEEQLRSVLHKRHRANVTRDLASRVLWM